MLFNYYKEPELDSDSDSDSEFGIELLDFDIIFI